MSPTEERSAVANPPKRRDSDASKSSADSSGSNPLMTLVDAATSVDDSKQDKPKETKTPSPSNEDSASDEQVAMDTSENPQNEKAEVKAPIETLNVITGTKEDLESDASKKRTFAEQLYDILEDEEHHDVLQWMPDGLAFTIVDHKKFTLNKMPKLFNIRNMSSFVRKLGRWGFSRVHEKATRNSDIFKHPFFERGKKDQCKRKVKCVGRAATAAKNATPATVSPLRSRHGFPMHLHTVSSRYGDAPLSPNSQLFMSNLSERSHLSQLSMSERSRFSFVGRPPSRVTFLDDHLPRLPSELPLYNEGTGSANPDSPTKQRALSKVTAASEASAAALFSQHQKQGSKGEGSGSFGRDDHLSPYEEARRLSELDRQLAEQQVALEHRKVALEHQRIVRQRQALMSQRRAMERQFTPHSQGSHFSPRGDGTPSDREMTSTSETTAAVSLDSSIKSSLGFSSRHSSMSREEAIRALLLEERQRSYNEARQRDRQLAGHPSIIGGSNSRSGAW